MADVHKVHERIDSTIRDEFERRGWQLVRNFNDGFGLPWQEVFSDSRTRSRWNSSAATTAVAYEWKSGGRLRTRQVRPAVRHHPDTGEPLWFNHAAFYHISSRSSAVGDALLHEFGEENLPFHTYYGDGGRIEPTAIAQINAAFDAEEIRWPWRQGDVHLFDNMRLSHGRQPFTGDRLILVALTEGYAGPEA